MTRYPCPHAEPCPGCGATTGVRPKPAPPKVQAWTCLACGMDWAISVVNPQMRPHLADLAATVELLGAAPSTLRQVIALVEQVDTLIDQELRTRLRMLANVSDEPPCPLVGYLVAGPCGASAGARG